MTDDGDLTRLFVDSKHAAFHTAYKL